MTIKELLEKMKLKSKKTTAIVGMSAALSATAVGCGQKEVVVEPATTTESVDETAVIEEETPVVETPVVEEPVVTTPVEVTPVVEEMAITPVTVEEAETRIAELTAAYPNEDANTIRRLIAYSNQPYFESNEDFFAVLGVNDASEINIDDVYADLDNLGASFSRSYFMVSKGVAENEIDPSFRKVSNYNDNVKLAELLIPLELQEIAIDIDDSTAYLVSAKIEDLTSDPNFDEKTKKLCLDAKKIKENPFINAYNAHTIFLTGSNIGKTENYYSEDELLEMQYLESFVSSLSQTKSK